MLALVHFNGIWAYAAKGTMKSCSQERPLSRILNETAGTCLVV
jgi:hypothetical protein